MRESTCPVVDGTNVTDEHPHDIYIYIYTYIHLYTPRNKSAFLTKTPSRTSPTHAPLQVQHTYVARRLLSPLSPPKTTSICTLGNTQTSYTQISIRARYIYIYGCLSIGQSIAIARQTLSQRIDQRQTNKERTTERERSRQREKTRVLSFSGLPAFSPIFRDFGTSLWKGPSAILRFETRDRRKRAIRVKIEMSRLRDKGRRDFTDTRHFPSRWATLLLVCMRHVDHATKRRKRESRFVVYRPGGLPDERILGYQVVATDDTIKRKRKKKKKKRTTAI